MFMRTTGCRSNKVRRACALPIPVFPLKGIRHNSCTGLHQKCFLPSTRETKDRCYDLIAILVVAKSVLFSVLTLLFHSVASHDLVLLFLSVGMMEFSFQKAPTKCRKKSVVAEVLFVKGWSTIQDLRRRAHSSFPNPPTHFFTDLFEATFMQSAAFPPRESFLLERFTYWPSTSAFQSHANCRQELDPHCVNSQVQISFSMWMFHAQK